MNIFQYTILNTLKLGARRLTIYRVPGHIEPVQCREFNAKKDSVEDLDTVPYLKQVENIADSESLPPQCRLLQTDIYPAPGDLAIDFVAEQREPDAQGCLETNLLYTLYYLFVTHEEYKYIQCGIRKKVMKTYCDNILKEENTAQLFPGIKNVDSGQKLLPSMPDIQALGAWELHTLDDMRWNDNHHLPIKYLS